VQPDVDITALGEDLDDLPITATTPAELADQTRVRGEPSRMLKK
jgi:hypothetical protein